VDGDVVPLPAPGRERVSVRALVGRGRRETMPRMNVVAALSAHTGIRLAEVGFLLFLIAGVWLVAAEVPQLKLARTRRIVAGSLLAAGSLLLIIATHWGQFG